MSPVYPACDRATVKSAAGARPCTNSRFVLAATIQTSGLAFVEGAVVNVGLPAIGAGLRADAGALQWVINGYLPPLSALLLLGGPAKRRDPRHVRDHD